MIEVHRPGPAGLRVARAALLTKLTGVRVIHGVAFPTARRHDIHRCRLVTRRAVQAGMRLDEAESGLGVIECRFGPFGGPMASFALYAIATLVVVVDTVTVDAATGKCVFEIVAPVTVVALQPGVRIGERKTCRRMIESNAAPRRRGMTILARVTFATCMHVIDRVTARAAFRRR